LAWPQTSRLSTCVLLSASANEVAPPRQREPEPAGGVPRSRGDGGQVGLLHRPVEPRVHLDALAKKGFQGGITGPALQHRGRSDLPRRASELTRRACSRERDRPLRLAAMQAPGRYRTRAMA